jgi:tetratricopeptide (TPR) repeat protein
MPYTINGIGTRYLGKHNVQQRVGVCRSCGRNVSLASYDTRLCFVVLFVPIIPLGKKHIVDACPACRRHFVVEMEKWEMARQLETSGALEKFRSEPTAENAIHAHQQLIAFHQIADAAELQRTMEEKFTDNAKVQVYLANVQLQLGKPQDAAMLFKRALDLRPDLPEARIGVAEGYIRSGQLDEARKLLDFLEKPGAAQLYNLSPLERLARACQNGSRHAEAVDLFGKILQALPDLGRNPQFRKWVKTSEKASGNKTTILPKAKFSFRRFFAQPVRSAGAGRRPATRTQALAAVAIIAAILLTLVQVSNVVISHGRTLCVVNGTGQMIQGEITGLGRIKIPHGETTFRVKEGRYVAKFDPPFQDEIAFDIRSKYFDRWTYDPAWVLNPDNSAIIVNQRIVYAKTPQPGSFSFEFGQKLTTFRDVKYPFTPPPSTVQLSSTEQQRVVGALQVFRGTDVEALNALVGQKRFNDAYRLAEWRLGQVPDDQKMMNAYLSASTAHGDLSRYAEFLRSGMNARPIRVEWHRAYQNLLLGSNKQRVIGEYDSMLATNSADANLLYLRGRLCDSDAEGLDYFNRSLQADPANPYAAFALAFHAESAADWATAKRLMDKPVQEQSGNSEFTLSWSIACLGLNDLEELEQAWRKITAEDPLDLAAALNLC